MKYICILTAAFFITVFHVKAQEFREAEPYAGEQQLKKFLCQEVIYPEEDLKAKVEGTVLLGFMIDSLGGMTSLMVKESVSPAIDREALRLIKKAIWTPASKMGIPIPSYVNYPIKFEIKKYNKHCKNRGYEGLVYPYQPVDTSNKVYSKNEVDKIPKPVFEDPRQSISNFILQNLKYPEEAFSKNISGTVVLSFVVETNGRVSHVIPVEPLGGGCTQEAIRILELLDWMPGIKNKMAVRTITTMSITFKLAEQQDLRYVPSGQNQGI